MNRKARRAAAKQAGFSLSPAATDSPFQAATADDVYAAAISHYRKGEFVQAENLCRLALNRDARHLRSLVLLGDIVQQGGRNKLAVKLLNQALELDRADAAAHDNIAIAYQALGRMAEAVAHFTHAMALGLRDPEILVKQSAAVTAPLKRLADAWPRQLRLAELLGAQGAGPMAQEAMLLALLQSKVVHDLELERLLTAIRRGLLQHAIEADRQRFDDDDLAFFCALAQQCFLNEYVFALDEVERAQVQQVARSYCRRADSRRGNCPARSDRRGKLSAAAQAAGRGIAAHAFVAGCHRAAVDAAAPRTLGGRIRPQGHSGADANR